MVPLKKSDVQQTIADEAETFEVATALAHGIRILVVEDNLINQKVAVRQLKQLGYESHTASNGHEAIVALEQTKYDVVLMDCQMPELDGYATTQLIREKGQRDLPIIAMTANAIRGVASAAFARE